METFRNVNEVTLPLDETFFQSLLTRVYFHVCCLTMCVATDFYAVTMLMLLTSDSKDHLFSISCARYNLSQVNGLKELFLFSFFTILY